MGIYSSSQTQETDSGLYCIIFLSRASGGGVLALNLFDGATAGLSSVATQIVFILKIPSLTQSSYVPA